MAILATRAVLKPFMNNKPFGLSYVYEFFLRFCAALETTQKHVREINFTIQNPSFAKKRTNGLRKDENLISSRVFSRQFIRRIIIHGGGL